jgi:hypothetical protein
VGAVLAVAVAGGVLAFRSPASESSLHERPASRRYGLIVGLEFALAGVGAAALGAGVLLTLFGAVALAGRR